MGWLVRQLHRTLKSDLHPRLFTSFFADIQGLSQPRDWDTLAKNAESKCQHLVHQAITEPPSLGTIQKLDEISDTLCQVLDAAVFCRSVHSDGDMRLAADRICSSLGSYVHELNTHYALYTALKYALVNISKEENHGKSSVDEETLLVGHLLLRDFERYGVHLSGEARDRMAELVASTHSLGHEFTQNIIDSRKCGVIHFSGDAARKARLSLPPSLASHYFVGDALIAPGTSSVLTSLMTYSEEEFVRKEAYKVYCTHPQDNALILDHLVSARHEIANLMGYPSYSAYQLDGFSLAGAPQAVDEFLNQLAMEVRPAAEAEARRLRIANSWDRDWAIHRSIHRAKLNSRSNNTIIDGLARVRITMDGFTQGLDTLLRHLMGVTLQDVTESSYLSREQQRSSVELWAPHVRKLVVKDSEDGNFLGTVYLDLYKRPGKFPGAAHFTLRCGRQRLNHKNGREQERQTPIVALVANFIDNDSRGGCIEGYSTLETALHEFGHALNSLLSRTKYQHVSGTRGPQDVVEIPSHIFERVCMEPWALSLLLGRDADDPEISAITTAAYASKQNYAALGLQSTLSLCAIDQVLHGENPPVGFEAVEREVSRVMDAHSVLSRTNLPSGTWPHLRFNHIVGYGANYYCYLYAQAISSSVWEERNEERMGKGGSWGKRLRKFTYEPGGAKEAHHYVTDLLANNAKREDELILVGERGYYPRFDSLLRHLSIH